MNPYATGLAPVAAEALGRGSGLFSLLRPLDWPRQAVANAGQSLGELLGGERSLPSAMMGMAPALGGAALGGLMGNPLLGLALGGGLAQGALGATGMEEFDAPTPQDVAGSLGMGGLAGTVAANAMIDPLTFLGMPSAARALRAPVDDAARGMGLAGPPTDALEASVRGVGGDIFARSSEAATLGQAEDVFGRALAGVDDFAARTAPGGELRFGGPLADPNAAPGGLQAMLQQAQDPRLAYLQYTPESQAMLPSLGEDLFSQVRVGGAQAPDVMEFLGRTNQALLPPAGGRATIAGQIPPGLDRGAGGWLRVGAEGMPPPAPQLQLGELPPDLLRPSPAPSLSDLALGAQGGRPVATPALPPSLAGVTPEDLIKVRRSLAGIGDVSGGAYAGVADLPLDQALAVLARERGTSSSALAQALARAQAMGPDEQALFRVLFPGVDTAAAPVSPGALFNPLQ